MKCSIDEKQFRNRLRYEPKWIELQLLDNDFSEERWQVLRGRIRECQEKEIEVILHHPIKYKGRHLDILHEDEEVRGFYKESTERLGELCDEFGIRCVIHPNYADEAGKEDDLWGVHNEGLEASRKMRDEIKKYEDEFKGVFVWENSIEGLFAWSNPYLVEEIVKPLGLDLVHDISHTYIDFQGDMEKTWKASNEVDPYVTYFHIVDSLGQTHDGLELGEGTIDWERMIPLVRGRNYICEIGLEDFNDASPMKRSYEFVENLLSYGWAKR